MRDETSQEWEQLRRLQGRLSIAGSSSGAIFRISEHHGTSRHLQTARVLSAQARKAGNVESCLTSAARHGSAVEVAFR